MPNEIDHLLAQCDPAIPLDDKDRVWLNAEPVGHEVLDEHCYIPQISDPERFIDQLRESLAAIEYLGQPLEIADLANEIGLLLGRVISNKAVLEKDFQHGFAHGVDLAHREQHDQ
ncbi:hypothetical protein [uncultured Tolumonas sp.]|uniref:hypothetical protein n=1 Tax=uncultured Tolumonas sp. TaxID=263765 RepID=UPI00292EF9FE|nr:hypothetical protein [uncultured Tolumonas sp.]